MKSKYDVYTASDYAGLESKNIKFYYGYEHSLCPVCNTKNRGEYCDDHPDEDSDWCFIADFKNKQVVIPFSKMAVDDKFDTSECLLFGISTFFDTFLVTDSE